MNVSSFPSDEVTGSTPLRVGVGIVAKAPVPGHCKTRLSPPLTAEEAAAVYQALLLDTAALVERCDGERFMFAAPEHDGVARLRMLFPRWQVVEQRGANLGERLLAAVEHILLNGCDVAIMVGSDAPLIPLLSCVHAWRWLAENPARDRAVFGPSGDGGYYLIALSRPLRPLFSSIPWSTPAVMAASRRQAQDHNIELMELPPADDVDDHASLMAFVQQLQVDPTPRACARLLLEGPLADRVARLAVEEPGQHAAEEG